MKFKSLLYILISFMLIYCCSTNKSVKTIKRGIPLQVVEPFNKCNDPVEIFDIQKEPNLLDNLSDLSYSTMYTSIYTHNIKADSLEKDSLRFLYAKRIKSLIKTTFPKIEMTNDSILLRKNYWYMVRYSKAFILNNRFNERIKKYTTKVNQSNKQLFIKVSSYLGKIKFPNRIGIYIFDIQKNELLYRYNYQYDCDIRDYEALEKAISFGLVKLKENFE